MICKFYGCDKPIIHSVVSQSQKWLYDNLCAEHVPHWPVYRKTNIKPTPGPCVESCNYSSDVLGHTLLWKALCDNKWYCCCCSYEILDEIDLNSARWSNDGCNNKHEFLQESADLIRERELVDQKIYSLRCKYTREWS